MGSTAIHRHGRRHGLLTGGNGVGSGNLVTRVGVRPAVNVAALVRSSAIGVLIGAISGLVLLVGIGLINGGAVRRSHHR